MNMIEKVARAMMDVYARLPGGELEVEVPVLSSDPDFDDLPRDHTEGTLDDEITQEAVLRLARAAIEAMREPTGGMLAAGRDAIEPYVGRGLSKPVSHQWQIAEETFRAMIDETLASKAE